MGNIFSAIDDDLEEEAKKREEALLASQRAANTEKEQSMSMGNGEGVARPGVVRPGVAGPFVRSETHAQPVQKQTASPFPPTGHRELDEALARVKSISHGGFVIVYEPDGGYNADDVWVEYGQDGSTLGVSMSKSRTTELFVHFDANIFARSSEYPVSKIIGALESGVSVVLTARERLQMPEELHRRADLIVRRHRASGFDMRSIDVPVGKRDVIFVDRAKGIHGGDTAIIVLA